MTDTSTSNFESRDSALKEGGGTRQANRVKMWLAAIAASSKAEDEWRKGGDEILKIYRSAEEEKSQTAFNILYSNTETLLPALYNSTPVPDIRRRYNDPGTTSKAVADILERSISYSIDCYDFDATIRAALFDAAVPGRGVVRVRYTPYVEGGDDEGAEALVDGDTGQEEAAEGEQVTSHEVRCEYVPWKNFRHGPGLVWDDVDWIAFEHFLSREQLKQLDPSNGPKVKLDCTATGDEKDEEHEGHKPEAEIFGRARVWEIWDRIEHKVLFLAPSFNEGMVKEADDPLKLTGFYPIPRPMQFVDTPTNLVPVPPYACYKPLAEELNEVTARIRRIVAQLRVKGFYGSTATDLQEIVDADDGVLVPIPGLEAFIAAGGDVSKAISWWPIEPAVKALAQLYEQREAIKNTIYEVAGIADIMRGQTKATETATAQNIKAQWGSLRVQRSQAEVQRFCRDVFRMMAELISTFYDMQTLMQMTGVELYSQADKSLVQQRIQMMQQEQQASLQQQPAPPPQAAAQGGPGAATPSGPPPIPDELLKVLDGPSLEEVEQLLRSDIMRSYRVDVESDSTVRADLTRNQEAMTGFITGAAQYIQGVGEGIQMGIIPKDLALTVFAAFSRQFKLGKQVEDSIEKAMENAQEEAKNPPPPPKDPALVKAETDAQLAQQKQQADMQAKAAELQMKKEEMQATLQMKQQEMEMKLQLEQQKMQNDLQISQAKANTDMQIASSKAEADMRIASEQSETQKQIAQEQHGAEMARGYEAHSTKMGMEREAHGLKQSREEEAHSTKLKQSEQDAKMRVEEHKAKQPKPTPKAIKVVRGKDGKITGAEIH